MTAFKTNGTISYLSKSRYILGLQCSKALWLSIHRPEMRDEVSAAQEAAFQSGTDLGILARDLFPGGVEIPYEGLTLAEQLARTRQAIDDGVTNLYEATFSHAGVLVKADLLYKGEHGWELYEVKGSTRLKDVYLHDIAVQYYVVSGAGLPLAYAGLVHVNGEYVRQGAIDVGQLFTKLDLTMEVTGRQPEVREHVANLQGMLAGEMPEVGIGPHCSDPYTCPFHGHCWEHVPYPSVFDLAGRGKPDPFALYEEGLVRFEDLPLERLGWRQRQQVEAFLSRAREIDREAVRDFLGTLFYPLSFLDFETTCMTPVPLFDGTRPYQAVPFQFSLHVLRQEGGDLEHFAWLAEPDDDNPQAGFGASLLAHLPGEGTVITWNMTFEKRILRELAGHCPEYASAINGILDRIVDLIVPFRQRAVYDWRMMGSASLKDVLPALVPDLSYEGMTIADGGDASSAWLRMREIDDKKERESLRQGLLEYCHLDTLAMERILLCLQDSKSGA